jgi:hypothetical protein
MKKYIFLVCIFAMIFSGCETNNESKKRVVKGRILLDCSGKPLANTKIELMGKPTLLSSSVYEETTTDAQGNFAFSYVPKGADYLIIRSDSHGRIMELIPNRENVDLGEILPTGYGNFVIKLKANKEYTDQDTIYYTTFRFQSTHPTIIGPFKSGVIDSIINYPLLPPAVYNDNNLKDLSIGYRLGKRGDTKNFNFQVDRCGKWGEVTMVID